MGVSENTLPRNQKKSMKIPWVRTHVSILKQLLWRAIPIFWTRPGLYSVWRFGHHRFDKKNLIGLDPSPSCFGGFKYMGGS